MTERPSPTMTPTALRTEYLTNPLGLDVPHPRLFWRLDTDARNARQSAYRILVASTEEKLKADQGDLWDTGRIESDETTHIRYEGAELKDLQRAHWKVMAWHGDGNPTPWSEPAFWESGLSEWNSEWIGGHDVGGPRTFAPAPFLRTEFHVEKPIAKARLVATAFGLYEARLNGGRVGEDLLAPGWTDYDTRVRYQVYDVKDQLRKGANCLGAVLGDGWYCGHIEWRDRQRYGDRPRLRAELHLTYEDGTTETIATGPDWRTASGEILENDLVMGVAVDARRALGNWDEPGYDDAKWHLVDTMPHPERTQLVGTREPTIRVTEEIRPVELKNSIFDLGQNMVGRIRLRVKGKAGGTVKIRYAERLDKDGKLYTENLRAARQTDYYTLKGDPEGEVFEPPFTFHGFQYVEVRGGTERLQLEDLTGIVFHSDNRRTGDFSCSDELVNQLQRNIDWGWRGNSVDVPTDCPQRDERLGWTGDAQVFVRTAAFNRDVAAFFAKYQQDLEDAQNEAGAIPAVAPTSTSLEGLNGDGGPAWADAFIICPWTVYLCYGDKELLRRHYPAMKRFVHFLEARAIDSIRSHPKQDGFAGFADWLNTNAYTPNDLIGTAFFSHSARLLAKIARVLGEDADGTRYDALADQVRDAFLRRFVTPDGLIVAQTQTAYVLALHFNLLPEALRPTAVQALVDDIGRRGWKLSTGFVGTPYLPHVLTKGGRPDVAYRLLFQKDWPSYLYAVTQGATTIWERWDGWTHDKGFQDPGMNSFNHYAYGAIGEWMYSTVAGLDLDESKPGYKHLDIHPTPGEGLDHAEAHLDTLHGRAATAWRKTEDGLHLEVTVPPNCTATVRLPGGEKATVTSDAGDATGYADGAHRFEIASGTYQFDLKEAAA
ncbi:MAG: family 78 glycoside hydrolase catalytic domain [Fimbriimonas sp.]